MSKEVLFFFHSRVKSFHVVCMEIGKECWLCPLNSFLSLELSDAQKLNTWCFTFKMLYLQKYAFPTQVVKSKWVWKAGDNFVWKMQPNYQISNTFWLSNKGLEIVIFERYSHLKHHVFLIVEHHVPNVPLAEFRGQQNKTHFCSMLFIFGK